MSLRRPVLVFLLASLSASIAAAHPHVFINNRMTVLFEGGKLKGISFRWTFDDMFSSMILTDFKPGVDGNFNAAATNAIKTGAFDNLKNYHYFLALFIGGKAIKDMHIERFTPSVVEGTKLVYSFFVPLDLPIAAEEQTVSVTVYDDTYYVAFDLMRSDDVKIKGDEGLSIALSIEKTKVKPLWPGQYMPDQVVIRFKESS
jgi:ABC-type uncharacterized transport system substrate-binding protein